MIVGDGSPSTMFSTNHWIHSHEDQEILHTPKYLSHVYPGAKIVAIFRNPVAMTFSSYKFFHENPSEMSVAEFHTCVVAATNAYRECVAHHDEEYCILSTLSVDETCTYTARSLQVGQFHGMYEYFGILVKFNNLSSDT